MRRFKADLLANEATVQYQMAQRWLEVERALEAQILALAEEVNRLSQEGAVSQRQLYDLARYQSLLAQLQLELRGYTQYANALIEAQQAAYGLLGRDHAVAAIEASYIDRVAPSFDRLPVETVQSMVGLTGSGTPLRQLLEAAWPDAADGLTQELIRSTALGLNPRDTARRMADGATRTLNRMLVIARTEQLRVYRETSRLQYQASGVVSGYRRIATRDSRTCAGCLAADGREYGLNEEFAAHPQCVVGGTVVSAAAIKAAVKRRYDGTVFHIRTASGNHLTVTPNHPILTDQGWVAAQFIQEGDYVISSVGGERATLFVDPDNQHGPAVIEDVVAAFGESGNVSPVSVPVAAEDFHGDGMDGDVAVVWANRLLRNNSEAAPLKRGGELEFFGRGVRPGLFAVEGAFAQLLPAPFAASHGGMGSRDIAPMLPRGSARHHQPIGGGVVPDLRLGYLQPATNGGSANTERLRQSVFGLASQIAGSDLLNGQRILGKTSCAHFGSSKRTLFGLATQQATGREFASKGFVASTPTLTEILDTFTSKVFADRVLQVSRGYFSGHVYNLETESGWYVAGGIITHNCRCALIPIVIGMPPPEMAETTRQWFERQSPETQREILGPGRYDLWRSGQVAFDDFAAVRHNRVWGDSIVAATVQELTAHGQTA